MDKTVKVAMKFSKSFYELFKKFCDEKNFDMTDVAEQVLDKYLRGLEADADGSDTIVLPRMTFKEQTRGYTEQDRLMIGKRLYDKQLTFSDAAEVYGVKMSTLKEYLKMYKAKVFRNTVESGQTSTDACGSVIDFNTNVKIEDVGLCRRIYRRLQYCGINDLETLIKVAEKGVLPAISNIGQISLCEIYDTLKKYTGVDYSDREMISVDSWQNKKEDVLKKALDEIGCKYGYI